MSTVLLIGNVGPKSAPFSTENHLARSFRHLGWQVIPVTEGPRCDREVRKHLASVDLVWYVRTHGNGFGNEDARQLWADCRKRGVLTVGFHLDRFVGIKRRDAHVSREYALFDCDLVASADGDDVSEAAFRDAGIEHLWIAPAIVHDEVGVGQPEPEYAGQVAWVGSANGYHREWPRRQQLSNMLDQRYGASLTRAGDGRTVREWDLNNLYASVKVAAGDSLALAFDESRYCSDRLFDTPGRGGVLVHPTVHDDLAAMLGDGVVWSDGWGIGTEVDKIDEVLAWSPERLLAQRQRAVECGARNTYAHRVVQVLDHLGIDV